MHFLLLWNFLLNPRDTTEFGFWKIEMDVPAILHLFDFLVHIGKLNERFRFDEKQIKALVSKENLVHYCTLG